MPFYSYHFVQFNFIRTILSSVTLSHAILSHAILGVHCPHQFARYCFVWLPSSAHQKAIGITRSVSG